jgi:thioredoxin 1
MADGVVNLTDATFDEEVSASDLPILVDFWAHWCGPCILLEPVLAGIAAEQAGKLRIGRLDVEASPEIARRFEINGLPTLILLQDGVPRKRISGTKSKSALVEELAEFL